MLDKALAILIAKCFGNGLIFELFWFESWSDFAMLLYSNHVLLVIDLKLELYVYRYIVLSYRISVTIINLFLSGCTCTCETTHCC